ncbi:MAG: hypothetical protein WDO56_29165 [Gammaproteobacteria bacterium]
MAESSAASDAAIVKTFEALGASFVSGAAPLREAFLATRLLIFDWDGVLGSGTKGAVSGTSVFNEHDSMGVNLLRYAIHRRTGQQPLCAIISGAANDAAVEFAKRERFNYLYTGVRLKHQVLEQLGKVIDATTLANATCFFDDVNDFPLAARCRLRLMIRRRSSPVLSAYAARNNYADYISACSSIEGGVRECCELLMALGGDFAEVIESRVAGDERYEAYFAERQRVVLQQPAGSH